MKSLVAWIAGIFAVGLALGSFVSGSGAASKLTDSDLEAALDAAPLVDQVDCGDGREALLEPIAVDGTTSFKVRCVETDPKARSPIAIRPAPPASPAPVPVVTTPPPPAEVDGNDADDSRTWKQSAIVVGGAAGAGAGIGAIAKGKKGAAVGAAIGAASGAAYELIKKDKKK